MNLITKIRCLVVEDDEFKLNSVMGFLRAEFELIEIRTCSASSVAMEELNEAPFDIVIIDMAIPSHPASAGDGSPYSLPKGGLDVIFEIDALGYNCISIILTQYPEVEINGCLVPVALAVNEIKSNFEISVNGCVQYFEDNDIWKSEFRKTLNLI